MEYQSQGPEDRTDVIAALIRAAGPRIAPPEEAYQQVLVAATAAFRAHAARRRDRNWLVWAAAAGVAGLAIALLLDWNPAPVQPAPVAAVARLIGVVEIGVDGGWRPVAESDGRLAAGARLRTLAGGRAALTLDGGASLRLAAGTEVGLEGSRRVSLRSGTLYLDNNSSLGTGYLIETPAGVVRDIGTQFELNVAGGNLRLRVREGQVEINHTGELLTGSAGEQLDIDVLRGVTRSRIPVTGASWQWAESIAPAPDFDGQPATVLLAWVARETGRQLHYESEVVRARAETVILHGNILHLEPLAALDVMLATTDLEYAIDGDTMEVRARTER